MKVARLCMLFAAMVGFTVVALGFLALAQQRDPVEGSARPNILVVFADDHGQWATGCYGNREVATPTLDHLADSGVMLANAACTSPVCSPSRASFFTGRIPSQHGIHDFLSEDFEYDHGWLDDEVLLPELLQGAGYRTALVGKWHCTTDSAPVVRGFDRWLSFDPLRHGWRNQYLHRGRVGLSDQGRPLEIDGFQTQRLTDHALEFIASGDRKRPFFLFVGFTDPHAPFAGQPERWVATYRQARFVDVPRGESSLLPISGPGAQPPADLTEMLAQYYAAVSTVDEQVGRMLDLLDARGELDRTLVVYTSDHGHMNGHHGLVGKGNATLPQNLYEEAIRVPCLLRWPQGLPCSGIRLELPFDHCDLFATVLDAAGVSLSDEMRQRIDSPGSSLLPRLRDPAAPWRRHQFCEHGNARMVADERFKLVVRYPPLDPEHGNELYDLEADPRETHNLIDATAHRQRVASMRQTLEAHFARYQVPGRSGKNALDQPQCNGREPWRRLASMVGGRSE